MLRSWKALRDGGIGKNRLEFRRSLAIGPHESKRARHYEGKGGAENGTPSGNEVHGVHVFQCRWQANGLLFWSFVGVCCAESFRGESVVETPFTVEYIRCSIGHTGKGSKFTFTVNGTAPFLYGEWRFFIIFIDQLGIIAGISKCIASRGANILNVDLYIDFDGGKQSPVFYARSEFAFDPLQWPRAVMDEDFAQLSHHFQAEKSVVRVMGSDPDLKLAVLVSWQDHCLIDLLHRWQEGELPVNLGCVISNHNRGSNTHVLRFLERHGIPYHYLPTSRGHKREEEILELVSDTDFLVLARYMQVLSPSFLRGYKKDIINIHHGLLPSFKGANPYRQAYEAGVKLIGATSHFVTEELDDGPIIEQMVDRVSHRDSLHAFATRSENLEKQCLGNAIKYFCEQRILRYSKNKTIVFG